MTKNQLIEKWEKQYKELINPDNATWEDLGFAKKPKEYKTVDEYLEAEGEFDEGEQTSLALISEFLEDLRRIK